MFCFHTDLLFCFRTKVVEMFDHAYGSYMVRQQENFVQQFQHEPTRVSTECISSGQKEGGETTSVCVGRGTHNKAFVQPQTLLHICAYFWGIVEEKGSFHCWPCFPYFAKMNTCWSSAVSTLWTAPPLDSGFQCEGLNVYLFLMSMFL